MSALNWISGVNRELSDLRGGVLLISWSGERDITDIKFQASVRRGGPD